MKDSNDIDLKVGDRVTGDLNGSVLAEGIVGAIANGYTYVCNIKTGQAYNFTPSSILTWKLKIISSNNNNKITNNMNLSQKLAVAFKTEPEKSFIKAGMTNVDGTFTTEGQAIFLNWILKANGDAFKKEVVDVLLAEEKNA